MNRHPTIERGLDDVATAIGFYTRLPVSRWRGGDRDLADTHWAAPVAGLAVGVTGALVYTAALAFGLPEVAAAALAVASSMAVTGALHEDGAADTADGFGGGTGRERKLEIMRDSRIGTYGVLTLVLSVLIRWSALVTLATPAAAFFGLIAAHAASRGMLPAFMNRVPPARSDGLSARAGMPEMAQVKIALAIGAVFLLPLAVKGLVLCVIALAVWFFVLKALSERQIGGQTGDVLGALQQGAECIVLMVAASQV